MDGLQSKNFNNQNKDFESQDENPIDELKKSVFGNEIKKDKQSDVSNNQKSLDEYLKFLYGGSNATNKYHSDIIKQAQIGLMVFLVICSVVTLFVCCMCGYIVMSNSFEDTNIISIIVAALIDITSAIMVKTMGKLMQSRDKFFMESINSDRLSKMIGLVQNMNEEDSEAKNKMIEKLIDHYCSDIGSLNKQ